jgi:hypothetical protein
MDVDFLEKFADGEFDSYLMNEFNKKYREKNNIEEHRFEPYLRFYCNGDNNSIGYFLKDRLGKEYGSGFNLNYCPFCGKKSKMKFDLEEFK